MFIVSATACLRTWPIWSGDRGCSLLADTAITARAAASTAKDVRSAGLVSSSLRQVSSVSSRNLMKRAPESSAASVAATATRHPPLTKALSVRSTTTAVNLATSFGTKKVNNRQTRQERQRTKQRKKAQSRA